MPHTIEINDIDDVVYESLLRQATHIGLSLPSFLRSEILALRPGMPGEHDTVRALDEFRGPWPT